MKTTKVAICDLTHTAQTISSEFMPYGQACIASYLGSHAQFPREVSVFKFIKELEESIKKSPPDIMGFSHYMWNADLSLKIAKIIKEEYPKTVIIFGGPNFPVEEEREKEWLKANRQVDFFIRLEGEKPFYNLVTALVENDKDIEAVKRIPVKSVCSFNGREFFIYPTEERIMNLDEIPSPYLNGYLDKYFETSLWPLLETNRGCPFLCAFCTEGYSYFNRLSFRSIDSVREELVYIAKRHRNNSMVFIADSNFLMYKRDLEICRILNTTQAEYNWPIFIGCSTGKNKKDIILEGAKLLKGRITIAASVQSMDEAVLKNIERSNISLTQLVSMAKEVRDSMGISYSELIACLPGDTVESHFESMKKLVASGISIIKHHVLLLLEGTYLASKEARERFGFRTMWRAVTKSFGSYEFLTRRFDSMEFEEIVVGTKALTLEGYLAIRRLSLVIHYFYNDSLFEEAHKILRYFGVPVWDWLYSIYENIPTLDNSLKRLYDDYLNEVIGELLPSKEELLKDLDKRMPEFISGKRGNNITFKYKALLLMERGHIRDAFDLGFSQLEKVLRQNGVDTAPHQDFLKQLKKVCVARKADIFDTDREAEERFNYDFTKIDEPELSEDLFSRIEDGLDIKVAHAGEQKDFIDSYFKVHKKDAVLDVASLLNRVPAKTMYRQLEGVCQRSIF